MKFLVLVGALLLSSAALAQDGPYDEYDGPYAPPPVLPCVPYSGGCIYPPPYGPEPGFGFGLSLPHFQFHLDMDRYDNPWRYERRQWRRYYRD